MGSDVRRGPRTESSQTQAFMTAERVSVVLPTRNGMATLSGVFDALEKQRARFPFDVVAVDSGSSDGTRAFLASRADRVIDIQHREFDHGTTRNLAVEASRGDLVVLLVQDAVPFSDDWLVALTEPLSIDHEVAGSFARQVPSRAASALTRFYLSQWVAAGHERRIVSLRHAGDLNAMAPMERLRFCAFDNVCSCIRREVWKKHPFQSTTIAEDLQWAREVLLAGYRLAYVPEAVVEHSHDRIAFHEFTRTRALHGRLFELFELQTIPRLQDLMRAVASSAILHLRLELRRPTRIPRALALAVAWPLGQYLGARASNARLSVAAEESR